MSLSGKENAKVAGKYQELFLLRPMTQFNDKVTIYQYMDATTNSPRNAQLEKRESKKQV